MSRPIAYEYTGFLFKNRTYPVWTDDEDSSKYYFMPPEMEVAFDSSDIPKVSFSVCENLSTPTAKGLANLAPHIPTDLITALKAEYGNIGPLPVSTGGQVMVTAGDAHVRGIAVNHPWDADPESMEGMSEEQKLKLKEARKWYEQHNVRVPLTSLLPSDGGIAIEVPNIVGSNIGAEIPISYVALGHNAVSVTKSLLDSGGVINGHVLYHYVGTTRPWKLLVKADLSKLHSHISESLSVGFFWAKADIYREVEKLKQKNIIEITVWDENDDVTGKYGVEKILDNILDKILKKAFDFYPNMKPNKQQAQTEGKRHWWWHGSYQRKSSVVDISEIINFQMTIHGKSAPIPVSSGFYLRVPGYSECDNFTLSEAARTAMIGRILDTNDGEELLKLAGTMKIGTESLMGK